MAIQKFQDLHRWMKINYPLLAQKATWSVINHGSLLIELPSMNKTLPAALFLGHLDVVPVEDSSNWKYPPFAGTIEKDTLWGRGALDDKNAVIALLESAEAILKTNKIPQRRILLAFGHDEEVGGNLGAAQISKYLKDNNVLYRNENDKSDYSGLDIITILYMDPDRIDMLDDTPWENTLKPKLENFFNKLNQAGYGIDDNYLGDLRLTNVGYDKNGEIKILDFNFDEL
jgi:hypothetical protein